LSKRQIDYEWVITSSLKENGNPNLFNEMEEKAVGKEKGGKKKKKKS